MRRVTIQRQWRRAGGIRNADSFKACFVDMVELADVDEIFVKSADAR